MLEGKSPRNVTEKHRKTVFIASDCVGIFPRNRDVIGIIWLSRLMLLSLPHCRAVSAWAYGDLLARPSALNVIAVTFPHRESIIDAMTNLAVSWAQIKNWFLLLSFTVVFIKQNLVKIDKGRSQYLILDKSSRDSVHLLSLWYDLGLIKIILS